MENIVLLTSESIIKQASEIRLYIGGEIFDAGSLILTNFRLLWISSDDQWEILLKDIIKVESTPGFFNISSPKIILDLFKIQQKKLEIVKDWECNICNTINQGNHDKCSECGVKSIIQKLANDGKVCDKCTFFNVTGDLCEMCEEPLYKDTIQVKISFRNGGMTEFLVYIQKQLNKRDWENIGHITKGIGGVSTVLDRINYAKNKVC